MAKFTKVLKNIGLKKNDIVFVHSDLTNLSFKKNFFETCEELYKSIINIIDSESSLLVPTFTYQNFNDKKIFNKKLTFSETGLFPEFIRLKKNSQIRLESRLCAGALANSSAFCSARCRPGCPVASSTSVAANKPIRSG